MIQHIIASDDKGRPGFAIDVATGETLAAKTGETTEEFMQRIRTWTALNLQQRRKARKKRKTTHD